MKGFETAVLAEEKDFDDLSILSIGEGYVFNLVTGEFEELTAEHRRTYGNPEVHDRI